MPLRTCQAHVTGVTITEMPPPAPLTDRSDLPFRCIAGERALDFVNTADWTETGAYLDRMPTFARLIEWARSGGVLDFAAADRLQQGDERPDEARSALDKGHALRSVLRRLFTSIAGREPPEPALSDFNEWLFEATGDCASFRARSRRAR